MMSLKRASVLLAFILLLRASAAAAATDLVVPATDGPVTVKVFAASGEAPRPAFLILHGRQGMTPLTHYERIASDLSTAGIDAWLFSYYSAADDEVMRNSGRAQRGEFFNERFRAWAKTIGDIAGFALAQKSSSGRVGLLGVSNGGFLAVGTAAADERIGALVVFYGGMPGRRG
jgi:carboxymethylenebutenolidase